MSHLYIVTSVISNALGNRMPHEMRLAQTLETIASVFSRDTNASAVIVAEGSGFQWTQDVCDVPATYFYQVDPTLCISNKSVGECNIVSETLRSDLFQQVVRTHGISRVFKLSGRYVLTSGFDNKAHIDPRHIVAVHLNNSIMVTVLYSFPLGLVDYILMRLHKATKLIENHDNIDIEHAMLLKDDGSNDTTHLNNVPHVGVRGIIGSTLDESATY